MLTSGRGPWCERVPLTIIPRVCMSAAVPAVHGGAYLRPVPSLTPRVCVSAAVPALHGGAYLRPVPAACGGARRCGRAARARPPARHRPPAHGAQPAAAEAGGARPLRHVRRRARRKAPPLRAGARWRRHAGRRRQRARGRPPWSVGWQRPPARTANV